MDNCESYYSQACFTCDIDKPLGSFDWHTVRWYVTADKVKPVPGGVTYGQPDRTCRDCYSAWFRAGGRS